MKARDGGGVLITQAIHTLDLFQSLAGPIARVSAMAVTSPLRRIDTEDIAAVAVGFANGAIGTIDATTSPRRVGSSAGKSNARRRSANGPTRGADGTDRMTSRRL